MRTLFLLLPALALAAPVPEADAEKVARAFVEKAKATHGTLSAVKNEAVASVFPDLAVFAVRFRQWPIAAAPAEGMRASNLLIVSEKGEPTLTTSGMQLSKLFTKVSAKDEKSAITVVKALLSLEAELVQDGFYKFEYGQDSFKTVKEGDKLVASGKMTVVEGGSGEITASVTFDAAGMVFGTALNSTGVKLGVRPKRLGD
jgi:hypothetical protein